MSEKLPDGLYPFGDEMLPLSELAMVEAPAGIERLLKEQAVANGVAIIRDQPVHLTLKSEDFPETTFLVWYPTGQDRVHLLVPKRFATGRA